LRSSDLSLRIADGAGAEVVAVEGEIKEQFDAAGDTQLLKRAKEIVLDGVLAETQLAGALDRVSR